jgi:hydroxymethylbilane synthase
VTRPLVIGARGSALSLRQVEIVRDALRAAHGAAIAIDVREIKTEGDRSARPLSEIGGLGVFTKAIEDTLLAGDIDIAVHSLKDLPPALTPGLTLAAIPPRADVRDALITRDGRSLAELRAGARIGTGSERRAVQIKALRADIESAEIRGNVPTRIAKVDAGDFDGAVLAMAGLERLGLAARASQVFTLDEMTPAVGQGALAVEVRTDDAEAIAFVGAIDDAVTRAAVTAERAFLARLGAGCRMPVGAHATLAGANLTLRAMIGGDAGITRDEMTGATSNADVIGTSLADRMTAGAHA